jgi:hypothetical protein
MLLFFFIVPLLLLLAAARDVLWAKANILLLNLVLFRSISILEYLFEPLLSTVALLVVDGGAVVVSAVSVVGLVVTDDDEELDATDGQE